MKRPSRLTAYWRAWWHLCPRCNSDAPAIDTCIACQGWRGSFPPPDWLVGVWLTRHFEPEDWEYQKEEERVYKSPEAI